MGKINTGRLNGLVSLRISNGAADVKLTPHVDNNHRNSTYEKEKQNKLVHQLGYGFKKNWNVFNV